MLLYEAPEGLVFSDVKDTILYTAGSKSNTFHISSKSYRQVFDGNNTELYTADSMEIIPKSIEAGKLSVGDSFNYYFNIDGISIMSAIKVIDKGESGNIYIVHPSSKQIELINKFTVVSLPANYKKG